MLISRHGTIGNPPEALTAREKEVFHLLTTTALTKKELAERLNITVKTVELHASNILRKRGAATRVELILGTPCPSCGAKRQFA